MTTAPQPNDPDTTPTDGGNVGTTPPEAVNTGTTPPEGGNQDAIDRIVKQRLERERRKWEADRVEAEKRARMDEAERLKADLADRDKAIADAKAEAHRERSLRALKGLVVDEEDAFAIAQRLQLIDDSGKVDVDALLKAKPYLAPATERPNAPRITGAPPPSGKPVDMNSLIRRKAGRT